MSIIKMLIETKIFIPFLIYTAAHSIIFLIEGTEGWEKPIRNFLLIAAVLILISVVAGSFKITELSPEFEFNLAKSFRIFCEILFVLSVILLILEGLMVYDKDPLFLFSTIAFLVATTVYYFFLYPKVKIMTINGVLFLPFVLNTT